MRSREALQVALSLLLFVVVLFGVIAFFMRNITSTEVHLRSDGCLVYELVKDSSHAWHRQVVTTRTVCP